MEYVSVLTGGPFTDHPSCTHWALAALARIINDRVDDDTRAALARRAPALARYGPSTPAVAEIVIASATHAMLRYHRDHRTYSDSRSRLLWTWTLHLAHRTAAVRTRARDVAPHQSFCQVLTLLHRFAHSTDSVRRGDTDRYLLAVLDDTLGALAGRAGAPDPRPRNMRPAPGRIRHMHRHMREQNLGVTMRSDTVSQQGAPPAPQHRSC
ncbi:MULTISPECIES: hypothetical protein [unclassified Pseudonocardia]|uniref:hypothetical protein n=1 Tax=unclassified Pseudonocardia TaxID=2619320 RepID=UPI0007615D62|nr:MULTISPECIES: hypothetical protein [unclassified Pseudonocardia]